MMKWPVLLLSLSACCGAFAQKSDPKRMAVIWDAVGERFSRQSEAWFHDGDYPRLVQVLRFHYALDPKNYDVGTNLGFMLENVEQYDEALAVYIQLRSANPADPDFAWPEANFYFQKKAYAKIPPLLEPTLKNHDPHANTYRTLAHAYEKMNMFVDSKRVWELYLSKHPEDLAAKANLNRILQKLKGGGSKSGR